MDKSYTNHLLVESVHTPSSEHAMPDWIRSTVLEELLDAGFSSLAEDALYRTMDKVVPRREAIESALAAREGDLSNLDRTVFFYDLHYDEDTKAFTWATDAGKRRKAEELDGSYLLRTDRDDLSADEAWRTYILLTQAEDAFRDMKSPLVLRPVYHQVARRVDTHIFLSILAYHLLVAIEKTLLDQGVHTSWKTLRDSLKTQQVCIVVLPTDSGAKLHLRKASTPENTHREIYRLLDVPNQVMKPRKTWIESPATGQHSDAKIAQTHK